MLRRDAEEAFWTALGPLDQPHRHLALYHLCEVVESPTPLQQSTGIRVPSGTRPLVKDSLGPPPVRVACTDAYDNSLWAWRWVDIVAQERGELPEWDPGWLGRADSPLPEDAFAYADAYDYDGDDFG